MLFLAVLLSARHMGCRLREMASNDVTLTCWSIDFQLRSHLSFTVNLLILVSPMPNPDVTQPSPCCNLNQYYSDE